MASTLDSSAGFNLTGLVLSCTLLGTKSLQKSSFLRVELTAWMIFEGVYISLFAVATGIMRRGQTGWSPVLAMITMLFLLNVTVACACRTAGVFTASTFVSDTQKPPHRCLDYGRIQGFHRVP